MLRPLSLGILSLLCLFGCSQSPAPNDTLNGSQSSVRNDGVNTAGYLTVFANVYEAEQGEFLQHTNVKICSVAIQTIEAAAIVGFADVECFHKSLYEKGVMIGGGRGGNLKIDSATNLLIRSTNERLIEIEKLVVSIPRHTKIGNSRVVRVKLELPLGARPAGLPQPQPDVCQEVRTDSAFSIVWTNLEGAIWRFSETIDADRIQFRPEYSTALIPTEGGDRPNTFAGKYVRDNDKNCLAGVVDDIKPGVISIVANEQKPALVAIRLGRSEWVDGFVASRDPSGRYLGTGWNH